MRIVAEHGQLVHVDVHITRHKKIDPAVAIVISPCRAGAEAAAADSRLLGHIFELAAAQVVVKSVAPVPRDVDVLQSVVVVVRNGDTHTPTLAGEAGGLGHVRKLHVIHRGIRVLMIERDHRVTALPIAIYCRSVHGDNVELAVIVAVDQSDSSAHRFDDVLLVGRRDVRDGETGLLRDVFKFRDRGWRILRRRNSGWRVLG